jgi:2,4-dienoyl-CoA reductase-like NADH-dependent reductase (Old Yellow Enzyme family)
MEAKVPSGQERWPNLYAPAAFFGSSLANRLVVAPMTRISATEDGRATPDMAEYYADYARGGFALVISEATYIDEAYSQGFWGQPGIANPRQRDAWRQVVDAVHAVGAPFLLQLYHGGAVNQGNRWRTGTIAPSAVRPVGEQAARYGGSGPYPVPREITRAEMAEVVDSFARAARWAAEAGFDGVEVHGANGYLIDQFLTDHTNLRTDEYGGSVENRVRFACEVLAAVRAAVPADKIVGIRISQTKSNDHSHTWAGGIADAQAIFGRLGAVGDVYIHVSSHTGMGPVFGSRESLAGLARRYSRRPVIACGKLDDPDRAEALITDGQTDLIAMAKAALADPAWPRKILMGETPHRFQPEMISPTATIATTHTWRERMATAG